LRGYAAGFGANRYRNIDGSGFGTDLKDKLLATGEYHPWMVNSHMMGETIPKDEKMTQDFFEQLTDMYKKAGFTDIQTQDDNRAPGLDIHEMGGVRMGHDPKTSLLNKWNMESNASL